MLTSVSTVCRMLNILPMTLKGWQAALLISSPHEKGYSEPQVAQIRVVRVLTSSGDTLSDIYTLLNDSWHYRPSGWEARRQEFILQLKSGTDETRSRFLWELYSSYSPGDIRTFILLPLTDGLCQKGSDILRTRFITCLVSHINRLSQTGVGDSITLPLLDIVKTVKLHLPSFICREPSTGTRISMLNSSKRHDSGERAFWKPDTLVKSKEVL
ncbi:MerR family transcriptional regulator [Franconibacter sp. IITDAS19]|uniref:MerR family transcriptional regulator n=1 Tax=Franconibacter sp. IITDAS19 TaxID=2930569 RepID=UPI001FFA7E3D|nr:MerR family transcriptional regulator [Franconibacter sp. IITDAS19]